MQQTPQRHVLWVGNPILYDTATEVALRDRLAARGWVVESAEGSAVLCQRRPEPFALVHCWDLSAVDAWLPTLCAAREAGICVALSPVYDAEYVARAQQRMLEAESPAPLPNAAIAWRFTRMRQRFVCSQVRMLLPTARAERDAIHRAFPEARCVPSAIVPACIAFEPTPINAAPPEVQDIGPYVLVVAPISPIYGQFDIIRAARNAGLASVMVGAASLEDAEYNEACRDLAPETIWHPALSPQRLAAVLGWARIVVHTARDLTVPLLAARLGVPVVLPATHYARDDVGGAAILYRRSDPESLDAALRSALDGGSPVGSGFDTASALDAAARTLAAAYDALAATLSRRDAPQGGDAYARFLEAELTREYRTNQMPDTVIASLEAEVAWYRRIAEEGVLRSELRRAEQAAEEMHVLAHTRFMHIRQLEAMYAAEQETAEEMHVLAHTRFMHIRQLEAMYAAEQETAEEMHVLAHTRFMHIRQLEAMYAAEQETVERLEDRAASLGEEVAWRRQTMEALAIELARHQTFFEARVRSGLSVARDRARRMLRPGA
jgi:glycosyltransferase involved in cell wall biosynthesis